MLKTDLEMSRSKSQEGNFLYENGNL
jgi:hypothetical protein